MNPESSSLASPDGPLEAPKETAPASSLGGELAAGLLGAGIAVACVLPPVVHFLTGPIGPLLAGFVAANRARPGLRGQAIIAVMVGTGVAGLMGIAATVLISLAGRSQLPEWFPTPGMLGVVLASVWLYGAVLAGVGTAVSGAFARKESRD